jgi:hypothetical protein
MQEVSDAGQQAAIEAVGKQFGHSRCHGIADASIELAVEVEAGNADWLDANPALKLRMLAGVCSRHKRTSVDPGR